MENNNSYEKFLVANKFSLNPVNFIVECSGNVSCDEEIDKVLSVSGVCNITSCENLNQESNVNGVISIDLIYLTKSNKVNSCSYATNFINKISDTNISPDCKLMLDAVVVETVVNSLSMQGVKVSCNVVIDGTVNKNTEITYLSSVSDDIVTKQKETDTVFLAETKSATFSLNNNMQIKEKIKKVLSSTCNVIEKNYVINKNSVSFVGQLFTSLVYLSDEENPQIKTFCSAFDFTEDIEQNNLAENSLVEYKLFAVCENFKTELEENDGATTVVFNSPIKVDYCVYNKKTVQTISDLFSVKNNLYVTSSGYNNAVVLMPVFFEKKVEGSVSLTDNEPRIDKLLAKSCFRADVLSAYIKDEKIVVNGLIKTNLIYLNDEENKICSVDVEMPFAVSQETNLKDTENVKVSLRVCDEDVMVKKGRDVYIDAVIKVFANVYEINSYGIISEIKAGDELSKKQQGLEIYFAKCGDDVWDIAKKLKVRPDLIGMQNEDISFPLEKDENITIYYDAIK